MMSVSSCAGEPPHGQRMCRRTDRRTREYGVTEGRAGCPAGHLRYTHRHRADRRHHLRLRPHRPAARRPDRALGVDRARRRAHRRARRGRSHGPGGRPATRRRRVRRGRDRPGSRHRGTPRIPDHARGHVRLRARETPRSVDRRARARARRRRWLPDGKLRREPARPVRRSLAASRRAACPVRTGCREVDDGPDRDGPGRRERCGLGDRLPRSGAMGLPRAGAAVEPVAGLRGDRDPGRSVDPDRSSSSWEGSGTATDACSSSRSACGRSFGPWCRPRGATRSWRPDSTPAG